MVTNVITPTVSLTTNSIRLRPGYHVAAGNRDSAGGRVYIPILPDQLALTHKLAGTSVPRSIAPRPYVAGTLYITETAASYSLFVSASVRAVVFKAINVQTGTIMREPGTVLPLRFQCICDNVRQQPLSQRLGPSPLHPLRTPYLLLLSLSC